MAVAWLSFGLAVAGGAAQLLGGAGYRWQWWTLATGVTTLAIGALAAAAATLIALAAWALALLTRDARTRAVATAGLVFGALIATPPAAMWRRAVTLPPIHDISTDTENPPRFSAILPLRAGAPNGLEYGADVAAQQRAGYPEIGPALLPHTPALAFELAGRAARAMGWRIVSLSPPDLRIEATATTWLFGFQDDVVVRITPAPHGSRVDVRSASRVGRSDIGANASRIRAYLRTLGDLSRAATG